MCKSRPDAIACSCTRSIVLAAGDWSTGPLRGATHVVALGQPPRLDTLIEIGSHVTPTIQRSPCENGAMGGPAVAALALPVTCCSLAAGAMSSMAPKRALRGQAVVTRSRHSNLGPIARYSRDMPFLLFSFGFDRHVGFDLDDSRIAAIRRRHRP